MNEPKYFFITSFQRSGSNWLRNCLDFKDEIAVSGEIYPSKNIELLEKIKPGDTVSNERLLNNNAYKKATKSAIIELMKGNFSSEKKGYYLLGDKSAFGLTEFGFFRQHKHISKIAGVFPDSKQILLIRDIRDIVISYSSWPKGENILAMKPKNILYFIMFVKTWKDLNNQWIAECGNNKYCLIIHFEEMKKNFALTIKQIYKHLEIEINEEFLSRLTIALYDIKSKFYKDANQQLGYDFYRKGEIGEWQTKLNWFHKAVIKMIAGPLLKKLNY